MADPAFGGTGTLQYTDWTSAASMQSTIDGVSAGDLLIAVVQRSDQSSITGVASASPALTFTRLARAGPEAGFYLDIWAALATQSASSQVITASYSNSANWGAMFTARYSAGVTSITPNASTAHTALQSSSVNRTNSNITTSVRTLLLAFGTNWDYYHGMTAASGWTERVDPDSPFGADSTTQFLFDRIADEGTYPSGNYATSSTADQYMSGIVALPVDTSAAAVSLVARGPGSKFNHLLVR